MDDKQIEKIPFMQRWKLGILKVSPLYVEKTKFNTTWIVVIGIIGGLVGSLMSYKTLWWLALILGAALINTLLMQVVQYQRIKKMEMMFEEINLMESRYVPAE